MEIIYRKTNESKRNNEKSEDHHRKIESKNKPIIEKMDKTKDSNNETENIVKNEDQRTENKHKEDIKGNILQIKIKSTKKPQKIKSKYLRDYLELGKIGYLAI